MSKKLKRSAVALVLAATMVFSSQGVLTAFAVGENETSTAVDVSALEPILDKEETVVVEEPGNTDETETPEVTESCDKTEGCTLSKGHDGECVTEPVTPPEEENGEGETQPCTKTEGCTLENGHEGECVTEPVTPPEEENGEDETQPCEKTEGCTLPNGHEDECVVEENTEDTEDTQEPSEEDVAAAKNVSDLIGALPEASTLDPETTDLEALTAQVKAAREAYDKLTDAQKALVEQAVLDKLVALEGALEGLQQVETVPETDVTIINESTSDQTFNIGDNQAIVVNSTSDSVITISNCVFNLSGEAIFINGSGVGSNGETKTKMGIGNNVLFIDCTINVSSGQTSYGSGNHCAIGLFGEANFENCKISISDWTGQGLGLYGDANVTFTNSTLSADGVKGSWSYAMYNSSVLTLDSSSMSATNMEPISGNINAFYSGDLKTNYDAIFIENHSTVHFYENKAGGFAINSVNIHVSENSNVIVENNSGNGSNSGHWYVDNSTLNMSNNGCHGLSAESLFASNNSNIIIDGNGYYGSQIRNGFEIDGTSTMTVTGNSHKGDFAGLNLTANVTNGLVEDGAIINISGNYCSGLSNRGTCTFEEGVKLTITNNENDMGGETSSHGGGVYNVGTSANLTLPSDAVIYNNHALTDGDDIYNTGTITFGKVGSDWVLDDCNHTITGWFDDSANSRWNVHTGPVHAELYEDATTAVTGVLALKAAHPYQYDPDAPTEPSEPVDWETSKSKTATNLDANYESQVTLSLPAKDIELVSDVVFVLDESSAYPAVAEEIDTMLEELVGYIEQNDITIKVGFVVFRGNAVVRDLEVLSADNLDEIRAFITDRPETGGSNMMAGLEAAQEMLAGDTTVDDSRKYMILISDGITYTWSDENGTQMGVNFANADAQNTPMLASPDAWDVKYGNGYVPSNWEQHLANVGSLMNNTIKEKASPYVRGADFSRDPFIANSEKEKYVSSVDIALYKCNELYQELASKYHCYTVMRSAPSDKNPEETESDTYPYGPSFMDYISGGVVPDFSVIEKEIIYLLDAGSSVIDVIGGDDNGEQYDYDFDFVNDLSKITLTVNGVEKPGVKIDENHYGFGEIITDPDSEYQGHHEYELTYYPNGLGVATMAFENEDVVAGELFRWDIYVPVKQFEPVQLTYTVKLANPKTTEGNYGKYDEDGSKNYDGLYTNNSAVLFPVDSNGNVGEKEAFDKPTVSYTVGSNDHPGTDPTPDPDPDPDRPSRPNRDDDDDWEPLPDAPVKDKPTTEVDVPEETETPTTEQPDKYNPETGDTTTVFAAMALAAVSLGGVVLLGRKKK